MKKVLIVGAGSAMAEATARIFAERGDALFLVARNLQQLQTISDDLKVRGAPIAGHYGMDANDFDNHESMLDQAEEAMGGLDTVLIAHGSLSDQAACQESAALTLSEIRTNALSVVSLLTYIANRFERQKSGTIAVISSVAGDRGRRSNYVYGSAKAMVSVFLSGLRQRLTPSGVAVVTIKPGFVDTPMTAEFKKGWLWAKPSDVAKGIVRAMDQKKEICYLPRFWYLIMLIIRCLPETVFKRLPL